MRSGPLSFVAGRYLLGRGREGGRFLRGAALGIALSLVPIMVTLIVADGMIRGITARFLELGTGHLQVYDYRSAEDRKEDLRGMVTSQEGVRGAWYERQGVGLLIGRSGKAAAAVRAVEPGFLANAGSQKYLETVDGQAELREGRDALVGEELASKAGLRVGDTVRLMTVRRSSTGRSIPRISPFTVRGIVSSGYRDLDALWFLIPYSTGLSVLGEETSRSFLMVKTDDPYRNIDAEAERIASALGGSFAVYTWAELQEAQFRSLESTRQLLLFIMALVVIVAAVNVSSATSMMVVERRREIAVLKSFGASPSSVMAVFLMAAFLTGLCGALAGIAAGLGIGSCINGIIRSLEGLTNFVSRIFHGQAVKLLSPDYYLQRIPIVIDWAAVALIGALTVLCSVLAAWAPARRAGKQVPVEILQKY